MNMVLTWPLSHFLARLGQQRIKPARSLEALKVPLGKKRHLLTPTSQGISFLSFRRHLFLSLQIVSSLFLKDLLKQWSWYGLFRRFFFHLCCYLRDWERQMLWWKLEENLFAKWKKLRGKKRVRISWCSMLQLWPGTTGRGYCPVSTCSLFKPQNTSQPKEAITHGEWGPGKFAPFFGV